LFERAININIQFLLFIISVCEKEILIFFLL